MVYYEDFIYTEIVELYGHRDHQHFIIITTGLDIINNLLANIYHQSL